MPAFYFGDQSLGGAYATFKHQPRFDLRRTPSQMGLATELLRRSKGARQSRHPVYRVSALGPLAEALTHGHEVAGSPCGRGTPFDFMANHETWIVGIGKSFEVLTQVHHAEDVMGEEFPVPGEIGSGLTMTLVDGEEEIPFVLVHRGLRWRRNMWKLRDILGPDMLREWTFHHVPMFATRAGDVTAALMEAARRGVTLYERPRTPFAHPPGPRAHEPRTSHTLAESAVAHSLTFGPGMNSTAIATAESACGGFSRRSRRYRPSPHCSNPWSGRNVRTRTFLGVGM